ncbi:MAG: hypothetical protein K0M46_06465 [Thiobacillus sp.]|nr:hypothetical protein [Thiobacillus sp.]
MKGNAVSDFLPETGAGHNNGPAFVGVSTRPGSLPANTRLPIYRGINRLTDYEVLREQSRGRRVVLLNSLNSFTAERERAGEFGEFILEMQAPLPKVFFFHRLLPGVLGGRSRGLN